MERNQSEVKSLYVLRKVPADDSKRSISSIISRPIMDDISLMSNNHPGLLIVAKKYALFITAILPCGDSTLLDITLERAMAEWHKKYYFKGCQSAFQSFCQIIFESLPEIINYTVLGVSTSKAGTNSNSLVWDCTECSLTDWIKNHGITNVNVFSGKISNTLSNHEISWLLASHIFNRSQLEFWVLTHEYSHLLNYSEA